jgi:type IV secretion system protein VirB10
VSEERRPPGEVLGERDTNAGFRAVSAQSRVSNVLAVGLMSVLGLGSLTWYYATVLTRQGRAQSDAHMVSAKRAQGDAPLPSLGRIDPPLPRAPLTPPTTSAPPEPARDPPPLSVATLTEMPVLSSPTGAAYGMPPPKSPAELALDRQLSGTVFAARNIAPTAPIIEGRIDGGAMAAVPGGGELSGLLQSRETAAVRARTLPAQRLLLPKGAFIDCTLETAIDSTLPGMTTCVMATDAFGVDGNVVLLERGTKLIGETRGQVQQGSARVFVLWTEARTPTGVTVPLDSPGADELGRSGLPGDVDRHFWQRFGAAMLVSVIDGAVQAAVQSSRSGNGTVVVNPSASQEVLTEILKNTINIPPTVVKRNGDRIQVLVARDLDFRSVYELRSASER